MDIPLCYFRHFIKGNNFHDYLLLRIKCPSKEGFCLEGKDFSPRETKSFPLSADPKSRQK